MKHSRTLQHNIVRRVGLVAAAAVLSPAPAGADTPVLSLGCGAFLGMRTDDQVPVVRSILSYDGMGFSLTDHARTDLPATRLAVTRCEQDVAATVYQALKGARG